MKIQIDKQVIEQALDKRKRTPPTNRTHGACAGGKMTSTYKAWSYMKDRCYNENNPRYENYGGRGIHVCERWMSFENFLADMGERPTGMSLDRVDNNGGYSPENCRWATAKQQQRNKRTNTVVTHNGLTMTLADWADYVGIGYQKLVDRFSVLGWDFADAINQNLKRNPNLLAGGKNAR